MNLHSLVSASVLVLAVLSGDCLSLGGTRSYLSDWFSGNHGAR